MYMLDELIKIQSLWKMKTASLENAPKTKKNAITDCLLLKGHDFSILLNESNVFKLHHKGQS